MFEFIAGYLIGFMVGLITVACVVSGPPPNPPGE